MTKSSPLATEYGSRPLAALRLMGFLTLILILVPANLVMRCLHRRNPFYVTLIFYRSLMKIMGFELRTRGTMATTTPVLFVANHTSYLDIPVLGALIPASFVAKAEVATWPLIGPLAKMQNTVFIERRSSKISGQRNYLRQHLIDRRSLILFPEGTSSDGQQVLPFKSALFSIVDEAVPGVDITIQPVSVTCTGLDGMPMTRSWRSFYAWYGDMTLVGHLWNVFSFDRFTIDVVFHPPIAPKDFADRKVLAQMCQQQVAIGVEQSLTGRNAGLETAATAPALAALSSPDRPRIPHVHVAD